MVSVSRHTHARAITMFVSEFELSVYLKSDEFSVRYETKLTNIVYKNAIP